MATEPFDVMEATTAPPVTASYLGECSSSMCDSGVIEPGDQIVPDGTGEWTHVGCAD